MKHEEERPPRQESRAQRPDAAEFETLLDRIVALEERADISRLEARFPKSALRDTQEGHLHKRLGRLNVRAPRELTIGTPAAGLVQMTRGYHTIDTASDASTDNLASILGGRDGEVIWIQPENDARTIVVKHNDTSEGTAGNRIFLNGGADVTLDGVEDILALIYDPAADSANGAWRDYPFPSTANPFVCYDYLVDSLYTGTEGAVIGVLNSTDSFRIYSTIGGAITNIASVDAQASYSIGICPATYAEKLAMLTATDVSTTKHIDFISLGATYEIGGQSTVPQVFVSPSSGAALEYGHASSGAAPIGNTFHDIGFKTGSGPCIDYLGTGANASHAFLRCHFQGGQVETNGAGWEFTRCFFGTSAELRSVTGGSADPQDLSVTSCYFSGGGIDLALSTNADGIRIVDCDFIGETIVLGDTRNVTIDANTFSSFTNLDNVITVISTATTGPIGVTITGNTFDSAAPSTGNGCIVIADVGGEQFIITITGNSFNGSATAARNSSTAWIKLTGDSGDKVFSCVVANNAFGSSNAQTNTLEDRSGFTVLGDFLERSVLGPNVPMGKVKYEITNGANNLIIPASADDNGPGSSGALPLDGHAILDASSHTDSAADAVTRGSVIVGNSTPAWDELVLGADHRFLGSDGTDAVYRNVGWDAILAASSGSYIQDAFDNGAKTVLLLDGNHLPNGNITPPTRSRLAGQSQIATSLDFAGDRRFIIDSTFTTIERMEVKGSTSASGAFDVGTGGIGDIFLKEMNLKEHVSPFIDLTNSSTVYVIDCLFSSNSTTNGDFIEMAGGTLYLIRAIMSDSNATCVTGTGIRYIDSSTFLSGSTNPCLEVTGGRTLMSKCRFTPSETSPSVVVSGGGIFRAVSTEFLQSPSGATTHNLKVSGSNSIIQLTACFVQRGAPGILLQGNGSIINTTEITGATDGISLGGDGDGNIITGCFIHDNSDTGIDITAASSAGTVVMGNRVISNTTAQITDSGTGSKILGNSTV